MLKGLEEDRQSGLSKENLKRIQVINPTETRRLVFLNALSIKDLVTSGLIVGT
jgi:hypothetical protein